MYALQIRWKSVEGRRWQMLSQLLYCLLCHIFQAIISMSVISIEEYRQALLKAASYQLRRGVYNNRLLGTLILQLEQYRSI